MRKELKLDPQHLQLQQKANYNQNRDKPILKEPAIIVDELNKRELILRNLLKQLFNLEMNYSFHFQQLSPLEYQHTAIQTVAENTQLQPLFVSNLIFNRPAIL